MEQAEFLEEIIKDAEHKASEIKKNAEKEVERIQSSLKSKKAAIKRETEEKLSIRLAEIEKRTDSAIEAGKRRAKLKLRENINSRLKEDFFKKFEKLIGTPQYDEFLSKLIAEGAISIDSSPVIVKCSFKEEITDEILKKAAKYIKSFNGKNVKIIKSDSVLSGQGVIIESENGRLSYNNLIETRLKRFDNDIRAIIIESLEKE